MKQRRPTIFRQLLRLLAAVALSGGAGTASWAQQSPQSLVDSLNRLPPEQRAAKQTERQAGMQAEIRERLSKLSPAERQQLHDQVKAQWQQLSPDERNQLRQRLHEQVQKLPAEERKQLHRDLLLNLGASAGK